MWWYSHSRVPAIGPTLSDQRQPGWKTCLPDDGVADLVDLDAAEWELAHLGR